MCSIIVVSEAPRLTQTQFLHMLYVVATAGQNQYGENLTLALKYLNQKVIHVTFTFYPLGRIYNMTTSNLKGAEKSSPMYRKRGNLKISEWQ